MWLLHFIFEGLFVYFFKTAGKDVTVTQNEMTMVRASEKRNDQKLPGRNQKKEKRAIALIAYEDISDGGGVYNN